MATISQAAIAASLLVGLLSVPVASQTVEISDSVSSNLSQISGSSEVPSEVSISTSPDGFAATIKSAFSRFTTQIEPGAVNASLENPSSAFEVRRTTSGTEWMLSTSEGTLTVEETANKQLEEVSTPQGTLRISTVDGTTSEEFSGQNRDQVEQTRHELQQLLEQKKQELDDRRQQLRMRGMADVEVVVNQTTAKSPEYVVLFNKDFEPVDIGGWRIQDEASEHTFESVTIGPRERLHVYSAEESEVEDPVSPAVFNTGISWNDNGDTATLFTDKGLEVDKESY